MIRSLIVTRASVAPQFLGPMSREIEFLEFNYCFCSGRRHSCRQRGACGDFINLEDLPAQSSIMLIGLEFAYVYS